MSINPFSLDHKDQIKLWNSRCYDTSTLITTFLLEEASNRKLNKYTYLLFITNIKISEYLHITSNMYIYVFSVTKPQASFVYDIWINGERIIKRKTYILRRNYWQNVSCKYHVEFRKNMLNMCNICVNVITCIWFKIKAESCFTVSILNALYIPLRHKL